MRIVTASLIFLVIILPQAATPAVSCTPDSPERRGEPGCSILAVRPLAPGRGESVYWHVDAFDSLASAQRAAGPSGFAFSAHGLAWVVRVERDTSAHRAPAHRAWVGPIPLLPNRSYMMQIMSAYFLPGQHSQVHTHSGPEAWYVVAGEQCLETPSHVMRASVGQGAIVAAGDTMRLVATGTVARRALALILYDAAQKPTQLIEPAPPLKACL